MCLDILVPLWRIILVINETLPMAKKKPPSVTVKILLDIHREARIVANHLDIDIGEYLSGLLAGPVRRDYEKAIADMQADIPRTSRKKTHE